MKLKAGIIGGRGYVAGELIRCLLHHPKVDLDFIVSRSAAGENIAGKHPGLFAFPHLKFAGEINPSADVVFLCLNHGESRNYLGKVHFSAKTRIIDLSQDFRLKAKARLNGYAFVYGLTEMNQHLIGSAKYIANPGCFATAIQLGLLPLAANRLLKADIHIHALTGATGAGGKLQGTTHFSWRQNNISIYKAFQHQHLAEIGESISTLDPSFEGKYHFLPLRGDFTRGIFASLYTETDLSQDQLVELYQQYYEGHSFVHITREPVHLKQVINTNHCVLQVQQIDGKVLITSVLDNLLKGAAGQAIQNMNLMFSLDPCCGLQLKANVF